MAALQAACGLAGCGSHQLRPKQCWATHAGYAAKPTRCAALCGARKQLALTQQQLALAAGEGVHFIVDLDVGKSTGRLKHVLRVIDALAGEIQLSGLPEQCEGDVHGATPGA